MVLICSNDESLRVLLSLIRGAQRRVVIACWQYIRGFSTMLISHYLNDACRRGIEVVIMYNRKLPEDDFDSRIKLIEAQSPSHIKLFVIDNTIISTDRNLTDEYYQMGGSVYMSYDLIFTSAKIADASVEFIMQGGYRGKYGYIDVSDGEHRLVMGMIRPIMDEVLGRSSQLNIITGTFVPSNKLNTMIIENKHHIVFGISCSISFKYTAEFFALHNYFAVIPKLTHFVPYYIHGKVIIDKDFIIQGSYNLDIVSEVYDQEQMVFTTNKMEIEAMQSIFASLQKNELPPYVHLPLPLSPLLTSCGALATAALSRLFTK